MNRIATNYDIRISRKEAEFLLKHGILNDDTFGCIMCKEYGQDDEWESVTSAELNEESHFDDDYETFEISFNQCCHKDMLISALIRIGCLCFENRHKEYH